MCCGRGDYWFVCFFLFLLSILCFYIVIANLSITHYFFPKICFLAAGLIFGDVSKTFIAGAWKCKSLKFPLPSLNDDPWSILNLVFQYERGGNSPSIATHSPSPQPHTPHCSSPWGNELSSCYVWWWGTETQGSNRVGYNPSSHRPENMHNYLLIFGRRLGLFLSKSSPSRGAFSHPYLFPV